jgi:uncharacterized protein YqgC (DUF456 family)
MIYFYDTEMIYFIRLILVSLILGNVALIFPFSPDCSLLLLMVNFTIRASESHISEFQKWVKEHYSSVLNCHTCPVLKLFCVFRSV